MTLQPVARVDADIAVIGSGFSGSLAAMALKRRGPRVVLVERGKHPRFAIGESSTPLANLLIEEFADRYDLPTVRTFSKWGTWRREHPNVGVGLKRGFTFLFHRPNETFADDDRHEKQLLVAASPHDEIGDTHWYRQDFDHALVKEAESHGVIYLDETDLTAYRDTASGVTLEGTRAGAAIHITASFVIDASGPRGCLSRLLGLDAAPLRWLPHTQGLYTHFEDVGRWTDEHPMAGSPYPPDDAALHHVFPGGWIWMLRFNNGITSAGAALTTTEANRYRPAEGSAAWTRLLDALPSVRAQFQSSRPTRPFVHAPQLAFRSRQLVGEKWALLPSSAGIIDPLLSTGFPLTLLGLHRLLDVLESTEPGPERQRALEVYERTTADELDVTELLVAALYACMNDPRLFKQLTLLYFAAASYSEAARRLGRPGLAPGFLLSAHPRFGRELRECAVSALSHPAGDARQALLDRIDAAIEPFDAAGLLDKSRRDWYPARAADLLANAGKLEATEAEIYKMLEVCGFGVGDAAGETSMASMSIAAGPTRHSA